MNAKLKPINTLDAFFKAYAQAVTILQLKLEKGSRREYIRFTSRVLPGKTLCPVTAVTYMRTHQYHSIGLKFVYLAATLAAITETVTDTIVDNADNDDGEGSRFEPRVRVLLLEPFPRRTSKKN